METEDLQKDLVILLLQGGGQTCQSARKGRFKRELICVLLEWGVRDFDKFVAQWLQVPEITGETKPTRPRIRLYDILTDPGDGKGTQEKTKDSSMIALLQRVEKAQLFEQPVSTKSIAQINRGILIFAAFGPEDSPVSIDQMAQKIKNLRIFSDSSGKMNLCGPDVKAEYLLVSQFTLYAECKYGNRPSFSQAAPKLRAKEYYEYFVQTCERILGTDRVRHGEFGSQLSVDLVNDGPVTIWLDSEKVL